MKKLFSVLTLVLLSTAGLAQVQQPDFSSYGGSIPAKINGVVQVSAFDYNLASQFATSFAVWNNFPTGCVEEITGYGKTIPFSTSAKVLVDDLTTPANNETVSLTSFTSSAPQCAVILSTASQRLPPF